MSTWEPMSAVCEAPERERVNACAGSGWTAQSERPQGWLGRMLGYLMALTNGKRSRWVLSLLDIQPDDRVLELGFGPGADIRRASRLVRTGLVAGVDHSSVMLKQATSRNKDAVEAGLVELSHASASRLPYASDYFDKVYSINTAQYWRNPAEVLREVRRVMKPGALVAIAVQPESKGATEETAQATGRDLLEHLALAGFSHLRLAQNRMRPVSVVCALGRK